MTQVPLEDFTNAYRAAHADELDAPAVLHRIRGTLRASHERRSRRRWVTWMWSMGLTTALGASLAYAAPIASALLQWVDESSEQSFATDPSPNRDVGSTPAPYQPVPSQPPALAPLSPVILDAAAAESSTRRSPSTANPHQVSAAAGPRSTKRKTAPLDAATHASSLYDTAQRLQFVEHDYAAALTAWDAYLEVADGPLRADARYNHAVCLVHLKRYDRARVELARLAHPTSAAAYRSRAATLLHSLGALSR